MATMVLLHAHPDDEAITTAGTMARTVDEGHRVVIVFATRGELGEVADGVLGDGEALAARRAEEARRAAAILGCSRVEFLGYHDSGMAGEPTNERPDAFAAADVEEAAARMAEILRAEAAEVFVIYDERGGYGHPDHVQVNRVGVRAAELAATPRVYEATMNRDHLLALMRERADELSGAPDAPDPDTMDIGMPAAVITTTVDVRAWLDRKRAAMAAHASQIADDSFFLQMPADAFAAAFGQEWFIRRGWDPAAPQDSLFPD